MSIKCINSPSNMGDKRNIVISVYRSPDMGGSHSLSRVVVSATLDSRVYITRIILRPLSALSLDEVNIAKGNITTGLFGLESMR
jgi:hypothetical protein